MIFRKKEHESAVATRTFYQHYYSRQAQRPPESAVGSVPGARFTKMWYRSLIEHVLPELELRGKRVLEVGAGCGFLAPSLCSSGAEYVGVDVADTALRRFPRVAGRCHAVLADGRVLPFPDAAFDLLVCMEVMEHLADPDPLLDECFRVVRPAGQLVFSCPNYCNFFLGVKLLSDLGIPFFSRYIGRQFIDRTTTSFELRRRLAKRGQILTQRAIRLHPPLFEQVDYRVRPGARLHRINDWIFQLEGRWGEQPPLSFLGLHTMCRVRKAPDSAG